MTINVALVTRDAVILGCDSVASTTKSMLEPWDFIERNEDGSAKTDENGRFVARFTPDAISSVPTDVWSGVIKMFELCGGPARVAGTTAGLAILNGRSMASFASQFRNELAATGGCERFEEVVKRFLEFMRREYDKNYAADAIPEEYRSDVEFLIGGYGKDDHFPSLYRVRLQGNRYEKIYADGESGIGWAGQSDGVARLIFGYDQRLRFRVNLHGARTIDTLYGEMSQTVARHIDEVLKKLKVALPEGTDITLPAKPAFEFPWGDFQLDIECHNLPLQDAVDLVSYLVNLQSGRAKFVRGVATVGGRTRIGYITRTTDFEMINEPEIVHRNTGFPVDL